MSRPQVFQAKPGPWVHLVRFLLLSSFLLTPPVLSSGFPPTWTMKCTVKSSWCSGTQADQPTTYDPPLKYCNESDNIEYTNSDDSIPEILMDDRTFRLQAFCYSYKKGYIQSPIDLDEHSTTYMRITNSCITLEVPDNHVIMTSFAGFVTEGGLNENCGDDKLTIHMKALCLGPGKLICEYKDYSPTVYDDQQRTTSFKFSSYRARSATGFRILYSFHPTYAKPEKLPGGKWNCSVPYYSDFQDHFMCSEEVFCQDGRDGQTCNFPAICGRRKGVVADYGPGQCFRVFSELSTQYDIYNWDKAEATCKNFGSRLIHLDSTAKWEFFLNMTKNLSDDTVFVGYKQAPSTDPEMYFFTGRWSNDTLAIFNEVSYAMSGECGAVKGSNRRELFGVDCTSRSASAFICETFSPGVVSEDTSNDAASLLPALQTEPAAVFTWIKSFGHEILMAKCRHNHTAHASLACDVATNCSAAAGQVLRCASDSRFSPAVPFFKCDIGSQFVPYSLVCDHRVDCWDASDERFCQFRPCSPSEWTCNNKKQCIPEYRQCNKGSDCVDGSDEIKCDSTWYTINRNSIEPPALVRFSDAGTVDVTAMDSTSCPETHFRCPGNGYCMPVYVLCNGVFDCPGKEDEMGCDLFTCPGFYRCRNSRVCVHHKNLCDKVYHCPQHDDELYCYTQCPDNCTCYGYAFICTGARPRTFPSKLRYLEASGTGMTFANVSEGYLLIHLSLRHCNIAAIGTGKNLPNLRSLDLSYNQLTAVTGAELSELNNLRYLYLAYNPLILDHLLDGSHVLPNIYELNFAGLDIPQLTEIFFAVFPNLRVLNLSNSGLNELPETGFQTLKQLRTLDLSACSLQKISPGIFDGLEQLNTIISENYKLCCPSVLPVGFNSKNCFAQADEVSSCDALLRSDAFRVFLSVYALLSLVGNLGSFVYKNFIEKSTVRMGFDVFVTHLNISDFLMGIYLAIIGVADRTYYGDYIWNDVTWRHSAACKVAGFLSFLSSEMSAFLICLITLERFLVIRFPFKRLRFSRTSAHVTCVALWIISFVLSAVPLLPTMKHWEVYSQSGICVPLPITRKGFPGQDYSFSVMIGLNFVLFVMIAVGQGLIYSSIRSSARACRSSSNSKDMAVAHRLLTVVMTDFLCWFPIGLAGIMAKSGVSIPGDVNVGMAIFVLPFNSALNPFLYTFNMVMERRRKTQKDRLAKEQRAQIVLQPAAASPNDTRTGSKTWTESEALVVLGEWLDEEVLSVEKVRQKFGNRV